MPKQLGAQKCYSALHDLPQGGQNSHKKTCNDWDKDSILLHSEIL